VIHAVVETQIALGDELSAAQTLDRLLEERLDRHDAIQAIGSVLAEHLHSALVGIKTGGDLGTGPRTRLDELSAESWRRGE